MNDEIAHVLEAEKFVRACAGKGSDDVASQRDAESAMTDPWRAAVRKNQSSYGAESGSVRRDTEVIFSAVVTAS